MIGGFVTMDRVRRVGHAVSHGVERVGRGLAWIGVGVVGLAGIEAVVKAGQLLVQPDDEVLRQTAGLFNWLLTPHSTDDPRGIARRILLAALLAGIAAAWWSIQSIRQFRRPRP